MHLLNVSTQYTREVLCPLKHPQEIFFDNPLQYSYYSNYASYPYYPNYPSYQNYSYPFQEDFLDSPISGRESKENKSGYYNRLSVTFIRCQ